MVARIAQRQGYKTAAVRDEWGAQHERPVGFNLAKVEKTAR